MAIVRQWHGVGVPDGTAFDSTPTEASGTGDTAPTTSGGGLVVRVDPNGKREAHSPAGAGATARWTDHTLPSWGFSCYFRFPTDPRILSTLVELRHTGTSLLTRVTANNDGRVSVQTTAGAAAGTSPSVTGAVNTTPGTTGIMVAQAAGAGRYRFACWPADKAAGTLAVRLFREIYDATTGTTTVETLWSNTYTIGTFADFTQSIWGKTGLTALDVYVSDVVITNTDADPGPWAYPVPSPAGTVNAGADKADLEPGTTVTRTATTSGITDAVHSWSATMSDGSTPPALTGANTATVSYVAPATLNGVAIALTDSVTSTGGPATDTATDVVLSAADRVVRGGVFVPAYRATAADAPR